MYKIEVCVTYVPVECVTFVDTDWTDGLEVSLVPGSLCRKQPGNLRNLLHVGCNMAAERNLAVKDFFQCLWQRTVPFVYSETELFSKPQNILCMRKEAEWNSRRKSIFSTITRWIAPMFVCWLKISLVHFIRLLNNLDSEISSERYVPSLPQWEAFFFGEKLHVHFLTPYCDQKSYNVSFLSCKWKFYCYWYFRYLLEYLESILILTYFIGMGGRESIRNRRMRILSRNVSLILTKIISNSFA